MASKQFYVDIDLNLNQLIRIKLEMLASHPTAVAGRIYYNTTQNIVYYYDGTQWIPLSGDISEVIAGAGLTGGGTSGAVTLNVNPDNSTIEIFSDAVRIKDDGVTTAKLATNAVTTIKITDKNITFAKIQDIPTMTVIGRVTGGTGVPESVAILNENDFASNSPTSLATQSSIKAYVDGRVADLGQLQGNFDASVATDFPVASGGTNKGDYWYVTGAGTVHGEILNIGDMLIAKVNAPNVTTTNDWIFLQRNLDQATETVLGVVRLATAAEVLAGTDTQKVITPATLVQRTATETRTGIAEIATQAETDTGTDDTRIVTPLKLKTYYDALTGTYSVNIGNGSATSFTVTHALNTLDVLTEIVEIATGETVEANVARLNTTQVQVSFAQAPTTNQYRITIKK